MTFVLTSLFEKIPLCFSENPHYIFQKLFPALSDVRILSGSFWIFFFLATPNGHKNNALPNPAPQTSFIFYLP
jgi:hypothetical protein